MTQSGVGDFPINASATSGTELATILNVFQQDYVSTSMGSSRPPQAVNGTYWINDSTAPIHVLYLFDGANDIKIGEYDTTTSLFTFENVGGIVYFALSTIPPANPKSGDWWYQTDKERLLVYDGAAWRSFNRVIYYLPSTSPPSTPSAGEFWYQVDTLQTFLYDQSTWVWIAGEILIGVGNQWANTQVYAKSNKVSPAANIDLGLEPYVDLVLSSSCTITISNFGTGRNCIIEMSNSSGGDYNLTWPTTIKWPATVDPSKGPSAGSVKIFTLFDGAKAAYGNLAWEGSIA